MKEGNPQVENGYVRIATELFDALISVRIAGEQRQCLDFIIRKTYGFNKKEDCIALSQFYNATGIQRPHIIRALKGLIDKNIIIAKKGNKKGVTYKINKKYSTWKLLPKRAKLPKKAMEVAKKGILPLPKMVHTIDNTTIDNITIDNTTTGKKKTEKYYMPDSPEMILSKRLLDLILLNNPDFKRPDLQKWCKHIELMITRDNRSTESISRVISFCQNDDFWSSNILSTQKLREKFDQLKMKMSKTPKNSLIRAYQESIN